jgi:hypothetical protein
MSLLFNQSKIQKSTEIRGIPKTPNKSFKTVSRISEEDSIQDSRNTGSKFLYHNSIIIYYLF